MLQDLLERPRVSGPLQQRRRDAATKAEELAEQQRLRLLEKERVAEANRLLVRPMSISRAFSSQHCMCTWAS